MKIKKIFIATAGILAALPALSQFTGELGAYEFLPQRNLANPALRPEGTFNIGFPGLSNIYLEHRNNWFRPKKHVSTTGDESYFDSDAFLEALDEFAITSTGTRIDLFTFGLKVKKSYFSFHLSERFFAEARIPRDMLYLAAYGNVNEGHPFPDNTADLSGLAVNAIHYREFSLAWAYELNEKISLGLRGKFLYGMENIQTDHTTLKLQTDPFDYAISTEGSFLVNTAGIGGGETGEGIHENANTYMFGLKNKGFGADVGATYKVTDKLQLQASINDIGRINWKTDVVNYQTGDGSFAFDGIDMSDFLFVGDSTFNDSFDNSIDSLVDDLEERYNFQETYNSYSTGIYAYTRIAAEYQLFKNEKASGKAWTSYHVGVGNNVLPSRFQLGYYQEVGRWLSADLHFTQQAGTTPFFGAGFSLNGGPFQLYALVENLQFLNVVRIYEEEEGSNFLYPVNSGDIRVNFGLNFTFGRNKDVQVAAKPMI